MKKSLYNYSLFCNLRCALCKKEKHFSEKLVYRISTGSYACDINLMGKIVHIGENEGFVFDDYSKIGWIISIKDNNFCFKNVNNESDERLIQYKSGNPRLAYNCFIYKNEVVIEEPTVNGIGFYIINLEDKTCELITKDNFKKTSVRGIGKDFVVLTDFTENMYLYYYKTNECVTVKQILKQMEWNERHQCFIGLNEKNCISFYNPQKEDSVVPYIKGISKEPRAYIHNSEYYLTDHYLYFAKIDNSYIFGNILKDFTGIFSFFLPNAVYYPKKWYRYDLNTRKMVKLHINKKFIEILGTK